MLRHRLPTPAKWAYMQEIGRVRYVAENAFVGSLALGCAASMKALAFDETPGWLILAPVLFGALLFGLFGYWEWWSAVSTYGRRDEGKPRPTA